jgi:DNA adenine methylase
MGAASVFLQKRPVEVEVLNDANGRVVNFFRQLRDNGAELIRRIELTPWAEDEYGLCKTATEDPVEDARRLYVASWQSVHGVGSDRSGWRWVADPDGRRGLSPSADWIAHDLHTVAQRLRRAHISNRDALKAIRRMVSLDSCLIYFDPPYTLESRTRTDGYGAYEVSEVWHEEAAELLRRHAGYVVVSGYASPLYERLYEQHGWRRVDRAFSGNSGSLRTESLWLSPRADRDSLPLFRAMGRSL